MEKILSNLLPSQHSLDAFILPLDKRPNVLPKYNDSLPIIDLGRLQTHPESLIGPIMRASEEYGFFQVTNHGLEKIMKDMMNVSEEFFKMSVADKMEMFSEDPKQISKLHSSRDYKNLSAQFWRDSLTHPVNPPEDFIHLWPSKPSNYREVAGEYSAALRSLGLKLLGLICQGLGLPTDYFEGELTKTQLLTTNHYPPCPNPSLTLGLPKHHDPNTVTFVQQGNVAGLQFFIHGEWVTLEPVPNALIFILGRQLQFITNGKIKSTAHQAVTNSEFSRTTLVTFITPTMDSIIVPAQKFVDEFNPPKFKVFEYKEFIMAFNDALDDNERIFEGFEL